LNSASLVMIPSGYKEDTVFSAIPTDGSGDLSFTRASNGTRVNSAGLVEVCPWNLLTYSEQFDNAAWIKSSATITANDAVAPNGTMTADKVVFAGANNFFYQQTSFIGQATASIYVKGTAGQTISIDNTQVITEPLITLTGEWQRITLTSTTSGSTVQGLAISTLQSATARTIYVWGGQVNVGSTAKPYFPTTDRLNVPRLTYQNGGGGCPSLLLEKQSTNYLLWSQAFTNTWATYNGTTTDNETISPDGTQNASKVIMGAGNSATIRQAIGGLTNGSTYTFSLYIKQGSGVTAFLDISDTASTVNITPTSEWVRYTYTANWNTSLNFVDIELRGTSGSAYCYIWGAQLEASSYVTSYINTTSSSATRVADVAQKTGISSLIGQTSGTILWDLQVDQLLSSQNILNIDNGSFGDTIYFLKSTAGSIIIDVWASGVQQSVLSYSLPSVGRYKIAFAYANNDFALYVNGVSRGTDSSGSVPATSRVQMGNGALGPSDGKVNELVLFKTRLSNSELQSLTTL
jgi:hypothetical protein